jgi:hypothetical protein
MPEHSKSTEAESVTLAFQALLFASGEMEGAEAAAFEARLGEDQAAREALCQAVQLANPRAGLGVLRPDPSYRDRVRKRVQRRPTLWSWLAGKRSYRGHPLAWTGLGAAACLLIILGVAQGLPMGSGNDGRAARPGNPTSTEPTDGKKHIVSAPTPPAEPATSTAEAKAWADLQVGMSWRKRNFATPAFKH